MTKMTLTSASTRHISRYLTHGAIKSNATSLTNAGATVVVIVVVIVFVGFAMSVVGTVTAQQPRNSYRTERRIENARLHLGKVADYETVARFKLASRKDTYRLGELITIDAAVLNLTNRLIFLLSDFQVQLTAVDPTGKRFLVVPYGITERIITPTSYLLTSPEDFVVKSTDILAGCDEQAFRADNEKHKPLDVFNRSAFVNWGDGCLQINQAGTYYLTAELTNNYVVVSADEPLVKTAVGRLESSKLKITIVE